LAEQRSLVQPSTVQGAQPPPPRHADDRRLRPVEWTVWAVAFALVSSLVLIGALAARSDGYVAIADDAQIAARSVDVFSSSTPLLGMPASTERFGGVIAYHPGPLLFWVYAPFVALLGAAGGLLAGAAALNIAAVAGCGIAGLRRGGLATGLLGLAAAASALLVFGGPAGTFRPINSIAVNVVFVAFVIMSWGIACGDRRLVPWWILAGSITVQAELIFLVQVVVIGAVAVSLGVVRAWRSRTRDPGARPVGAIPGANVAALVVAALVGAAVAASWSGAPLVVAAVVGLVAWGSWWGVRRSRVLRWLVADRSLAAWIAVVLLLWSFPLVEAIANDGGNLAALVGYLRQDVTTWGLAGATAALRIGLRPPSAPLTAEQFAGGSVLWSWLAVLAGLVLFAVPGRPASRRRMLTIATGGVLAAALAVSQAPDADGYQFHHLGWLPLIGVVVWFALAVALLDVGRRWVPSGAAVVVAAALLLASCAATLRWPDSWGLLPQETWTDRSLSELGRQVAASGLRPGTYGLVAAGDSRDAVLLSGLFEPLEKAGVHVLLGPSGAVFGENRLLRGHSNDAEGMLYLVRDDVEPPRGLRRIAATDPRHPHEVAAVADEVAAFVAAHGPLRLDEAGAAELGRLGFGRLPGACVAELDPRHCDPPTSLPSTRDVPARLLADLYADGGVAAPQLPPGLAGRLQRASAEPGFQLLEGPVPP
jgi:hypothetical protein